MNTLITLLFLMNLVRIEPLIESPVLTERAEARAEQLCRDNQWSHEGFENSFKGLDPIHGENLARNWDNDLDAFMALMNSPKHKENIVAPWFHYVGIGRARECNLTVTLFTW